MGILSIFGAEKAVFTREYRAGLYGLPAYFISRNFVELPFRLMLPVISSAIIYWMVGYQNTSAKFGYFLATLVVTHNTGGALGIFVASIFADIRVALQVVPVVLMPLMIFSGFFVNSNGIPVYFDWISYIAPMKYGYRALAINEFTDLEMTCTPSQMVATGSGGTVCPITNGNQVLALMGFDDAGTVTENIGIMIGLYAGMMMLSYIALHVTTRKPK
jgi:ABC-type multidrug transport system permease subunit